MPPSLPDPRCLGDSKPLGGGRSQYVELTESVDGTLDHRTDLAWVGDVSDRLYGLRCSLAQPFRGRHSTFFVDVREHHTGVGPREALGDAEPYTSCAPGDDRDPS